MSSQLFQSFYRTVKKYRPGTQSLSIRLGRSEWWLYKLLNPEDWTKFPIGSLIPLIEITKDAALLEEIAKECGYEIFKIPTKGMKKSFQGSTEFQQKLFNVVSAYHEFCKYLQEEQDLLDLSEIEKRKKFIKSVKETLKEGLQTIGRARHQVEKYENKQQDLFADLEDFE